MKQNIKLGIIKRNVRCLYQIVVRFELYVISHAETPVYINHYSSFPTKASKEVHLNFPLFSFSICFTFNSLNWGKMLH